MLGLKLNHVSKRGHWTGIEFLAMKPLGKEYVYPQKFWSSMYFLGQSLSIVNQSMSMSIGEL